MPPLPKSWKRARVIGRLNGKRPEVRGVTTKEGNQGRVSGRRSGGRDLYVLDGADGAVTEKCFRSSSEKSRKIDIPLWRTPGK